MLFSSYGFIFLYLPITFAVFAVLRRFNKIVLCKIWLVLASLYFYCQASLSFIPVFLFTIVFNYLLGLLILNRKNNKGRLVPKLLLFVGLAENIGMLGYYKYTTFILSNINRFAGTDFTLHKIILPVGISFFTFQLIAFLVDCYKKEAERYHFLDYLVFITFFPKLVSGPIAHHGDIISQLKDESTFKPAPENIKTGLFFFSVGLAKKILIAEPLITYAQSYYNNVSAGGFFQAWTAVLAYTFAYYFDFSGYSDMAMGIGLLFNIKLPVNFNSPYKARNFAEFWRRWHMTLFRFLNDYVFKSIYRFGERGGKLAFAVMVTFLVSGIWHGAGWNFVFWGLVNGIFVCMAFMMTLSNKKLPFILAWGLTFFGVLLTRVLFDSHNTGQAIIVYKQMFLGIRNFDSMHMFLSHGYRFLTENLSTLLLILASAVICLAAKNTQEIARDGSGKWYYAAYAGVLLTLSLFSLGEVSDFLYFQF